MGWLFLPLAARQVMPSAEEILARIESETSQRHFVLKDYTASRLYTLQNHRFGKQAAVGVLLNYNRVEGSRYTVLTRTGSDSLNNVIDKVLASEVQASLPAQNARHQISAENYRVRLLGTEAVSERNCYVLELTPRIKSPFLLYGKAWIDGETYGVVRLEGHFAASTSIWIGAPDIKEDFVLLHGFWLPDHVRSVTNSVLLGQSEIEIAVSNYQFPADTQIP